MSNKPRLHFHSDCGFFAGCENMLANFFNDARLQEKFTISFSFRDSRQYHAGFASRVKNPPAYQCPNVLPNDAFMTWALRLPKPLRLIAKVFHRIGAARYGTLIWNVFVLWRSWRKQGIDILHINNGGYPAASSCRAAVLAGRICGVKKIIMIVNNIAAPASSGTRWAEAAVDCFIARYTSIFITGSRKAGEAIRTRLNLPEDKVLNFHNGIANRRPDETIEKTKQRIGVSADQLTFGVVAILEPRKGHSVLINAFSELRSQLTPESMPVLLIEGSGPEEANLRRLVRQLQLDDYVKFVGQEKNVFNFLQAIDLFILPSINYEDFPNVILEAMSLGKPVLATKLSGIPEQIQEGITGWLVEPGDSSGLARGMLAVAQERSCLEAVGRAAKNRFTQMFTSEISVARYLELYDELLTQ